jgi:hypothetical protein
MRLHRSLVIVLGVLTLLWEAARVPAQAADPAKPAAAPAKSPEKVVFSQHIAPLLAKYCTGCHGGAKPKGDLALDVFKSEASLAKEPHVWEKVAKKLRAHEMPPEGRRQPTSAEVALLTGWIDAITKVDCTRQKDPGRVTIHRLNRVEYNNTIRDLVGVSFRPADDFPADDAGYGFDNIGDVLSLSPVLLEGYLAAAEKIVQTAFATPELKARIMIRQPTEQTKTECARQILETFARRAFRRPVKPAELERLVRFVELAEKNGDSFETGIQLALQAVLVSPHFLFRVELDREPRNPEAIHPVGDWELATRLSYFLWSSMPDDELFRHAQQGTLRKPEVLDGQVRRMLRDPRARALVENFAGQWLLLRNLKTATPDPGLFPSFDEALRTAMQRETELFFETIVKEDRSILDFLDADFTFLNERLARHYGIAGVRGEEFRRVSLTGDQRGGILTQASILTITSNPTRTSPVKRGKWILENILGTPPPPPPPDAGELSEDQKVVLSGSLRQRMEVHRAKASCASCHQRMDPLGFGFENFDAVGAWRTQDGKFPIDCSGTLPDGRSFKGPKELKAILKTKKDEFARCLSEKMLTYALGRGLEYYDRCAVDQIAKGLAKNNYRFTSLVLEIVHSDPFQLRRGKGGNK